MNDMTSDTKKRMRKILSASNGWACHYCGKPLIPDNEVKKYTTSIFGGITPLDGHDFPQLDHVYPRSKGGANTVDNLVLSCSACNLKKGAK